MSPRPGMVLRFGIDDCAADSSLTTFDVKMVGLTFANWNQFGEWLKRVEALRDAA